MSRVNEGVKDLERALRALNRARTALNDVLADTTAHDLDRAGMAIAKVLDRLGPSRRVARRR